MTTFAQPVSQIIDRSPPSDIAAELAVISSMIIDPTVIGPICMILPRAEDFYKDEHQVFFRVIVSLFERNSGIDALLVNSELRSQQLLESAGGIEYLKVVIEAAPSSANAEYYAAIVREKAMLRGLIQSCTTSLRDAYDSGEPASVILDRAEQRMFDLANVRITGAAKSLTETLHETFEILDKNTGEHITGTPTGYVEIDNLTCGLQKGELIIIAARPSVGKTALALNIAEHAGIDHQLACAVFSLEMSSQQLAQRMLCSRSGVDSHKLRRGMLSKSDRDKLDYAVGDLAQGKIFIDDTPSLRLMDLRTKARRLKLQHDIQLVVIDYLQLMDSPGRAENRQQEISTLSRGIKGLARELNVPVVCLSQLNRASETDGRRPRTSDLRESGAIEQDADVVLLLHREDVMHRGDQEWLDANPDKINVAEVIVAKQRNGPCDTVKLTFLPGQTRFVNYNAGVR
jgi:replicative DNA helicase